MMTGRTVRIGVIGGGFGGWHPPSYGVTKERELK